MESFLKYSEFTELNEKQWNKDVESSHLKTIDYDSKTEILEVEFWNGWKYRYKGVPVGVFREFADQKTLLGKAGSAIKSLFKGKNESTYGKRFWSMIRRGNYEYERIE